MQRTYIKDLKDCVGKEIVIKGWVNVRRDQGKMVFMDMRDVSGIVQCVVLPNNPAIETAKETRTEWVLAISGIVNKRPDKNIKAGVLNGDIEIEIKNIEVLNKAETPPFDLTEDGLNINEEVRMKYRHLDLRRERLQKNIRLRSKLVDLARQFLFKNGFTEIETPYLSKTTPEGSRDFVVPSRMYPGKFFALPQSPQQYKQLLMVAGFERYFQMARCFRDEDLRADRGFEHTQIDIETSFLSQEEFMKLDEAMITSIIEGLGYSVKEKPFPIFTYKEAMEKFGADKFDLRTEEDKKNGILALAWVKDFPFFEKDSEKNWTFTHNPFSHAKPEHVEWLLKGENIDKILTSQYDMVCNGLEIGGGSIRAHKPEMLKAVFRIMGYSDEQIEADFGHMLQALASGAPPHGGIAHGVERLLMVLTQEQYLREVQAFPQTSSGRTSIMDAPSDLTQKQLRELGLEIKKKAK